MGRKLAYERPSGHSLGGPMEGDSKRGTGVKNPGECDIIDIDISHGG